MDWYINPLPVSDHGLSFKYILVASGGDLGIDGLLQCKPNLFEQCNHLLNGCILIRVSADPVDYIVIKIHPPAHAKGVLASNKELCQHDYRIKQANHDFLKNYRCMTIEPLDPKPGQRTPVSIIDRQYQ